TPAAVMEVGTEEFLYYENVTDDALLYQNVTMGCPISDVQGAHIFLPITYSIIFVSGVLGNFFVIVVVGNRGARLVDTFVVNLALADLVFVLTLPLWATAAGQGGHWSFGPAADLLCRLSSYVIAVNRFSNIFFLTCMGVDRYLAVVKMMDSRYLRSSRCVRATCAAVWSASLLLGIPYLVYRRVERAEGKALCVEDAGSNFFLGLTLLMVLLTFILPIVIIVLCYSTIILHLNSHCAAAANPRSGARRRHSIKMVLSIITAFVVTWLPYNVFKVITTSSQLSGAEEECGRGPLAPHRACLAFFNSCINPAIYFFLDRHFRRRAEVVWRA
uniref:G protein-coupled receptor 25 n=1 Tax=Tetraodon nigroviridis TaxID=99883 RepID=H3DLM2_TETNG